MPIDPDVLSTQATPYSAARGQIMNGDIALFHGNEPFSKVIQTFTDGPWSHVGFVWRMNDIDRVMLLEAVDHLGVRLIPLSTKLNGNVAEPKYTGQMVIARHSQFPEGITDPNHPLNAQFTAMTKYAVDRVGCPYSAGDIANIAVRIMVGFAGVKAAQVLTPTNSYICSEYAYECYRTIGVDIPFNAEKFVSPNDFGRAGPVDLVVHISPDP